MKRITEVTDENREELIDALVQAFIDASFGDGQEEDMVRDGFSFKGYNNYTDKELLAEAKETSLFDEEE